MIKQLLNFNYSGMCTLCNKSKFLKLECVVLQLPYYFIEDLFIGGWMADRCFLPKVDIKEGFNMLPHHLPDPDKANATVDKVFHYIDGNYKLRVHQHLMKALAAQPLVEKSVQRAS
jgi:hypothetical protein